MNYRNKVEAMTKHLCDAQRKQGQKPDVAKNKELAIKTAKRVKGKEDKRNGV